VIPFTPDAKEIKIMGTNVIPEFGIMATMILGMALFSIIALTLKSKIITRF
jgi:predicted secreted protein with PEFG-CTERM motif